jgi:HlyD family secretion protein
MDLRLKRLLWLAALAAASPLACAKKQPAPLWEAMPVARRELDVSISAAGLIEPIQTVEVKSKASGEIMEMLVETGDDVRPGQLLARIDPRQPRNTLAQAEANLEVAQAQLQNAEAQKRRSDDLFEQNMIAETEYETVNLAYASARAEVVRARTELENARDQMEDTSVRAPIAGTVIQKNVELGTVISSPTRDVGGGTVLFRMANLDTIQVRALVDETDIGKVQAGLQATIRVEAFPNRPFEGRVKKIEPQATVEQNVTMFPVLVDIANLDHLLKPGMNTEVEVEIGHRENALTVPNAALRTQRDVASAAEVLGLDPEQVQAELAREPAQGQAAAPGETPAPANGQVAAGGAGPRKMTLHDGREVTLPEGVSEEQVRAILQKRMSGQEPTAEERALMRKLFGQMGGGGRGRGGNRRGGSRGDFGGRYIVFALRDGRPQPIWIQTGLTDLDHIEVTSGLAEGDTVLVLPSASLVQSQQEFRERFQGRNALPGLQQQQPQQQQRGGGGQR